jgi:hypothetical protein
MRQMKHSGHAPRRECWGTLLGLSLVLTLTGCASWTNPAKPSAAFADDAAACKDEVAQAALTAGQFDFDQDNAYVTCRRRKGWDRKPIFHVRTAWGSSGGTTMA